VDSGQYLKEERPKATPRDASKASSRRDTALRGSHLNKES